MSFAGGVVDFVEEGNSHRSAAAHFRVSVRFVNDMVKLKGETGGLAPKRQGNPGRGKLSGVKAGVHTYVLEQKGITLDELVLALREQQRIKVKWTVYKPRLTTAATAPLFW